MVRQISSIPLERQAFLIVLFSYIACPTHPALCAPPQRPHQAYPTHPCRLQQPHIRLPAGENVCDVRQQHKARVRQLPIYPSHQSSVVTPPKGSFLSSPFPPPPPPQNHNLTHSHPSQNLVQANRRFKGAGQLLEIDERKLMKRNKQKVRYAFLFTDMLLITKYHGTENRYRLKTLVRFSPVLQVDHFPQSAYGMSCPSPIERPSCFV